MIQAMQPDMGIAVVPFIFCAFLPETLPRRTFTSSGWSSTPWVLVQIQKSRPEPQGVELQPEEVNVRLDRVSGKKAQKMKGTTAIPISGCIA